MAEHRYLGVLHPVNTHDVSVVPLFDELAPGFDQLVPMFSAFATGLVEVMSLPPGTRLLDLGCGRGAVTRAALARGWEVVAVDAAPTWSPSCGVTNQASTPG